MTPTPKKRRFRGLFNKDLWVTALPALLMVAAGFAVAFYFVKPAPPSTVVLAVSEDEGGARYFARKYKEILARDGVTLELVSTAGSVVNLKQLSDPGSRVDVAFVQSGAVAKEEAPNLVSLGSLGFTPLWVFYRGESMADLRDLRGKRIGVGKQDSGTYALAHELLKANGVEGAPTQLLPLGREEAAKALQKGELDAMFTVSTGEAPFIKRLIAQPEVKLLNFAHAEAYVRRYPHLTQQLLPRGVYDFARDLPDRDVTLISPTAKLVAKDSLHPALAYLLLRAASEVHASAGIFDKAGEFPAALEGGFPLSSEAKRYYEAGVPFLQRYLAFWAANLVDRLWLMLVPLIAIAVPLGKLVPAVYQWRVRSRVFRWYARLKEIEIELDEGETGDGARKQAGELLLRLEEIERAVKEISTPLAYTENLYFFREHVDVVRRRLLRQLEGRDAASATEERKAG